MRWEHTFLLVVGSGVGVFVSVQTTFDWVGDHVSANVSQNVKSWILRFDLTASETKWPKTFTHLFTRLFGRSHWSWRSLVSSLMATSCSVTVAQLIWSFSGTSMTSQKSLHVILSSVLINAIPDYFGLLQTRYALRWMEKNRFPFLILVLDAVVKGVVIFLFFRYGGAMDIYDYLYPRQQSRGGFPALSWDWLNVLQTCFLAIFGSSVWIWLYLASGSVLRLLTRLRLLERMKQILPVEEHPLKAVGTVSGAIVTFGYWGQSFSPI